MKSKAQTNSNKARISFGDEEERSDTVERSKEKYELGGKSNGYVSRSIGTT